MFVVPIWPGAGLAGHSGRERFASLAPAFLCRLCTPRGIRPKGGYKSIDDLTTPSLDFAYTIWMREAVTTESGEYSITNILPGDYDVKATKQGFSTFTQTGLKITSNNLTRVDVQMKVGNVADVVFGLGREPGLEAVVVERPGGDKEVWTNVRDDSAVTLRQKSGKPWTAAPTSGLKSGGN